MARFMRRGLALALLFSLSACGGGGGGGAAAIPEVPFASFQARQPNQTLVMSGMSQRASGTQSSNLITSVNFGAVDTGASTLKLTFGSFGQIAGIGLTTPQAAFSLNVRDGVSVSCMTGTCSASNSTSSIAIIDPTVLGWNYQTFGVWARDLSPTTYDTGAISAGNVTPGSAVPLAGTALFNGLATGFYVNNLQSLFATAANMTANVDFAARTVGFATTGTVVVSATGGPAVGNASLDLAGTLSYPAGTNQFTGTVTAVGLSGAANGRFYGPGAEEIGGIYSLTGAAGNMIGGFGGKR